MIWDYHIQTQIGIFLSQLNNSLSGQMIEIAISACVKSDSRILLDKMLRSFHDEWQQFSFRLSVPNEKAAFHYTIAPFTTCFCRKYYTMWMIKTQRHSEV